VFGITFLEPVFLFGLLAAPLPIIIHLFQRRRARVVPWSSLEFVRMLQRPKTRRLDLRRLLLLLLRVLALALLVLALSRPAMRGGSPGAEAPSDAMILLDASLSMGATPGSGPETCFEQARTKAGQVVDLLRQNDRAALFLVGDPQAPPIRLSNDFEALRERISRAQPTRARLLWSDVLDDAHRILEASQGVNRELYLISDFQSSGWEKPVTAAEALASEGVRVYLLPVDPLPGDNLAIESVRVQPPVGPDAARPEPADGLRSERVRVRALVRNHGERVAEDVAVEFTPEFGEAGAGVVTIGPGEAVWVPFDIRVTDPDEGFVRGRVEIAPDAQNGDNMCFFALARSQPTRVLLVGRPAPDTPGSLNTRYLGQSLVPAAERRSFEIREVVTRDVTAAEFAWAQVIVLADCERLAPGALSAIKQNVADGTGLFLFAGPGTDTGFMNQALFPGLVDLRLEGRRAGAFPISGFSWGSVDARHPVFAVFGATVGEALSRARFTDALQAVPGADMRVVASFSNGLPALLEGKRGDGRVLVFTSSPDLSWGNFPLSGNFVPFVHEALIHLAHGREAAPREYPVGEVVVRDLNPDDVTLSPAAGQGFGLTLIAPDGAEIPVLPEIMAGRTIVTLGPLGRNGIYELRRAEQVLDMFVANPDPLESFPACLSAGDVAARLHPLEVSSGSGGSGFAGKVHAARYGRELSATLLWVAFVLLVLELLIRGGFVPPRLRSMAVTGGRRV